MSRVIQVTNVLIHRGELSGLLGRVNDINDLCLTHNINAGKATLHCDGLGAVSIASYLKDKLSPSNAHNDIIHSLFRAIQLSPLDWSFYHVYGHQDNSLSMSDMSDMSDISDISDTVSKSFDHKLVAYETSNITISISHFRKNVCPST